MCVTSMRKHRREEIHLPDLQFRRFHSKVYFHHWRSLRFAEHTKEIPEIVTLLKLNQIRIGIAADTPQDLRPLHCILKIAELIHKTQIVSFLARQHPPVSITGPVIRQSAAFV